MGCRYLVVWWSSSLCWVVQWFGLWWFVIAGSWIYCQSNSHHLINTSSSLVVCVTCLLLPLSLPTFGLKTRRKSIPWPRLSDRTFRPRIASRPIASLADRPRPHSFALVPTFDFMSLGVRRVCLSQALTPDRCKNTQTPSKGGISRRVCATVFSADELQPFTCERETDALAHSTLFNSLANQAGNRAPINSFGPARIPHNCAWSAPAEKVSCHPPHVTRTN
jgi:hypothetical protein